MRFYFAPMEGLTGYIYRNAHCAFFGHVDKYFSPFIVANQSERFKTKELHDILPENNQGLILIPQLLTNNADDFIHTAEKIRQLGYAEVNLNLGCPAGTIVTKRRGAGFLSEREKLDAFLYGIYARSQIEISIKTRIGKDQPEEFHCLLEIFNKYPIKELTIHPRIQKDFYRGKPNLEIFRAGYTQSKNPICYNGDIFTPEDYAAFSSAFPAVGAIMLGRGLLANPGLIGEIAGNPRVEKAKLRAFHDQIYAGYQGVLFGERNVLFKMKELWTYMILLFSDHAKYAKQIRKAERLDGYDAAVAGLFKERELVRS